MRGGSLTGARTVLLTLLVSPASCAAFDPEALGVSGRAISKGPPFTATLDGWTVTSSKPEYVGENLIVGKFTFEKVSGDAETRGGGACLVADLNDKYPCDTRQDCLDAQARGEVKPTPAGGFIYCEAMLGQTHRRCWTRPSAAGCSRSPSRVPGTYFTTPTSSLVDGQPVVWINVACLSAEDPVYNGAGCASAIEGSHVYAKSVPLDPTEDEGTD